MFDVTRSLCNNIMEKEKENMNHRISAFVDTLDVEQLANEIRHAIDTYVFGRDDSYMVFVPAGISLIKKRESIVSVSQPAGTARHPNPKDLKLSIPV